VRRCPSGALSLEGDDDAATDPSRP
jgi:hypothetical protein